jgi:hypothetical protein
MFWETELNSLAERKRRLIAVSDLERALAQAHGTIIATKLRWIDHVPRWARFARPAWTIGALVLGSRLGRWTRLGALISGSAPLAQRGLGALWSWWRGTRP